MARNVIPEYLRKILEKSKASRPEGLQVSLKVRAVDQGYLKGRIVNAGEEFLFNGKIFNGKLAHWMEPVNPEDLQKILKKHAEIFKEKPSVAQGPLGSIPAGSSALSEGKSEDAAPSQNAGDLV